MRHHSTFLQTTKLLTIAIIMERDSLVDSGPCHDVVAKGEVNGIFLLTKSSKVMTRHDMNLSSTHVT